jgi:hypothetical protein
MALRMHRLRRVERSTLPAAVAYLVGIAYAAVSVPCHAADEARTPDVAPAGPNESRPVVGPLLLGAGGVSLIAFTSLALASETGCDEVSASGICLVARQPDVVRSTAYYGVGSAAVAFAVLWHLLGGSRTESADRERRVMTSRWVSVRAR